MKFIYYSAAWCAPCAKVLPWVKAVAKKFDIEVETVDVSQEQVEGILSVPTLDIMAHGETLRRIVRWSGPKALMQEVEDVVS